MATSLKQRAVTMKRNGMDDSLVGAILGLEAAEVQSLIYDADPDVELVTAIPELQLSRVVLDDAQIKAMTGSSSTDPVIVPGVTGGMVDVLRVQLFASIVSGYTGIDPDSSLLVQYDGGEAIVLSAENANVGEAHVGDLFANPESGALIGLGPPFRWITASGGFQQPGYPLYMSELEGIPLIVRIPNGASPFGGGHPDNKLIVQTLFTVVSLD